MLLNSHRFGAAAPSAPAFRYFRLTATRYKYAGTVGSAPGADIRLSEFQLFTASDVKHPLAAMSNYTVPSPQVASVSDDLGSFPGHKVFDNVLGDISRWISNAAGGTHWVQIDLGAGNAIVATYARLVPDEAVTVGGGFHLVDFKIEGSTTGVFAGDAVLLLDVVNALTGWADMTPRQFNF